MLKYVTPLSGGYKAEELALIKACTLFLYFREELVFLVFSLFSLEHFCGLTFSLSSLFSEESLSTCFFILSSSCCFLRRHFKALFLFCNRRLSLLVKSGCWIFFSMRKSWLLVESSSESPSKSSRSSLYSRSLNSWERSSRLRSSSRLPSASCETRLPSYLEEVRFCPVSLELDLPSSLTLE